MTRVIFRKSKEFGSIDAVFVDEIDNYYNNTFVCYARIGQHGGCSLDWIYETKPATKEEYQALLNELKGLGYNDLVVINRLPNYGSMIKTLNNYKDQNETV